MNDSNLPKCCRQKTGIKSGLLAGIIPHSGCIAIILFAIFGITAANSFFIEFVSNPYYFHIIFLVTFLIGGIAAFFYIRRFEDKRIRAHWKYLSILFLSIIIINLIMIYLIFPSVANLASEKAEGEKLTLDFATLPCSGHTPLVISELQKAEGINSVKYISENLFDIYFEPEIISKEEIIEQKICKEFNAQIIK